jgi:2-iminobutanoate/2-iminopropanoate deaminase
MSAFKVLDSIGKWRSKSPLSAGVVTGDILWLSGQVPLNLDTGEVVGNTIGEQMDRICNNMLLYLHSKGLGVENVVRCTVYLVEAADFAEMNSVYARHFRQPYPARTTLIVKALANPRFLAELDVVAVANKTEAAK